VWQLLKWKAPEGERAMVTSVNGKIEDIKQRSDGGHDITIGGKTYHSSGMPMKVKVGDSVKKGDALQEGYLDPQDVLRTRGHRALQTYLVDEIEHNFGKNAPDRRYIEAIVGGLTRYAEVEDGGDSDYLPGSIVPANNLSRYNEGRATEMKPFQPVRYNPIFTGIGASAHKTRSDWGTSMIFGHMRQQIPDMAASGAVSQKHGPEPVMPFIYSQDFGENIDQGEY
jgi:DNA-directed RNA polymerase subunit beta'